MKINPSKLTLTGLIAASASLALTTPGSAQTTNNPFGTFFHTVDGQFSPGGEWSDITPSAFISTLGSTAAPTSLGDPLANTLLYAGLGKRDAADTPTLFLMYDFLPRTPLSPVSPGEIVATVAFLATLPGRPTGDKTPISVMAVGSSAGAAKADGGVAGGSFFDIFVDLDLNGTPDVPAAALGLEGFASFGPSPLSAQPHLLFELGVGLRIQPGFANPPAPTGPLPGGGINPATGMYDPDPVFWGASASGDGGATFGGPLQSASGGSFEILPNGSINVTPTPEPSTAILLFGSLGLLAARRRRAA